MRTSHLQSSSAQRQRGVYALEFALVFLVFFAMLYALLCYGALFAVRMGMQNATEEGARAGLRYQATWALRLTEAKRVTSVRLAWMKYPPVPIAQLCTLASPTVCMDGSGTGASVHCNAALNQLCQIVVSARYAPYALGSTPWLPRLPEALLPSSRNINAVSFGLTARASVLIDERSM